MGRKAIWVGAAQTSPSFFRLKDFPPGFVNHAPVHRRVLCWEINTRKGTGRWNENGLHHLISEVKESLAEKVTSDLRYNR